MLLRIYQAVLILYPTVCGTTIKSLDTKAVFNTKSILSHNRVLQTASPGKKQTFLVPTELPLHNFVQPSVAPSIPIVREQD